jgi:hypothetical protein
LATNLTVSASASTISSGGSVSFTARLKIDDNVMWPLLASEPLASRQITIQKRASGGIWTYVGTMSVLDDNGRYTKTLSPTDTFDYRVVFDGPGGEGLDGATSPILTVNVSTSGGGNTHCVKGRSHVQTFYQC